MKIRRFPNNRSSQPKPVKPKRQLPENCFRAEFYCEAENGFPVGQWHVALLYPDRVEYRQLPLVGYQTMARLINSFGKAEPVDGQVVLKLVTEHDVKIMSLTNNLSNTPD